MTDDNLIKLFPDMDSQADLMTIDELARELIRCMKEYGECMDVNLWNEIKILCPPDEYPREKVQKLDPIPPGPPRTLRQAFGLEKTDRLQRLQTKKKIARRLGRLTVDLPVFAIVVATAAYFFLG